MKARRQRGNSITAEVRAMTSAALPLLDPPEHCPLRAGDRAFWDDIIRARVRDQWIEADLVVAAQLARCQADIETLQSAIDAEGIVVKKGKGKIINPHAIALEQYSRRERTLLHVLRLGGQSGGRGTRDDRNALEVERKARVVRGELVEHERAGEVLLAS